MKKIVSGAFVLVTMAACGGGGGSPGTVTPPTPDPNPVYTPPAHIASTSVERQCAAPRPAGTLNPFNNQPYNDAAGSLTAEKMWIRSFINETYLWYRDVGDVDPSKFVTGASVSYARPSDNVLVNVTLGANYDALDAYFNTKRTTATTNSGKPVDKFHFTYPTTEWANMSLTGSSVGFGIQVALLASTPPRVAVVAYADPGTPAAENNLSRGASFVAINGISVANGDPAILNEALFSPVAGRSYNFTVRDRGASADRSFSMVPRTVTSVPVQNVRTLAAPHHEVGYILFNDHIATAESQLVAAVNQLKAANNGAGIKELVLDLRYNGGGYLDIAGQMAYMIAGSAPTAGKVFEKLSFNDKNPFGLTEAEARTPFHSTTLGFSSPQGAALPQLNLGRVFVLTTGGTCSASEAIMNGLRGVGVTVVQIGATTCGKPYGFIPEDNCGTTYFAVQFKGVNQLGYGDYSDGFIPGGTAGAANNLPGCAIADDFNHALGDVGEASIAAALRYRANGSCAPIAASAAARTFSRVFDHAPMLGRSLMRENRIVRPDAGRLAR
ncbi:MAG: S41 family peptidase [Pseudomonadota bacterium]